MKTSFELAAEFREDQGKGASRRLRHLGKVPAILYGGRVEPSALALDHARLSHMMDDERFYSTILSLKVGDQSQAAVLKDVQRHPWKNQILHVDLQRVLEDEPIRMKVPLHFRGGAEAIGVRPVGGCSRTRNDIEALCRAEPAGTSMVDVPALEINQHPLSTADAGGVPRELRPVATPGRPDHAPRVEEEAALVVEATAAATPGAPPPPRSAGRRGEAFAVRGPAGTLGWSWPATSRSCSHASQRGFWSVDELARPEALLAERRAGDAGRATVADHAVAAADEPHELQGSRPRDLRLPAAAAGGDAVAMTTSTCHCGRAPERGGGAAAND
jgi:large subunit ribosomal protein L25